MISYRRRREWPNSSVRPRVTAWPDGTARRRGTRLAIVQREGHDGGGAAGGDTHFHGAALAVHADSRHDGDRAVRVDQLRVGAGIEQLVRRCFTMLAGGHETEVVREALAGEDVDRR